MEEVHDACGVFGGGGVAGGREGGAQEVGCRKCEVLGDQGGRRRDEVR